MLMKFRPEFLPRFQQAFSRGLRRSTSRDFFQSCSLNASRDPTQNLPKVPLRISGIATVALRILHKFFQSFPVLLLDLFIGFHSHVWVFLRIPSKVPRFHQFVLQSLRNISHGFLPIFLLECPSRNYANYVFGKNSWKNPCKNSGSNYWRNTKTST